MKRAGRINKNAAACDYIIDTTINAPPCKLRKKTFQTIVAGFALMLIGYFNKMIEVKPDSH
jgi:hypothetical protein